MQPSSFRLGVGDNSEFHAKVQALAARLGVSAAPEDGDGIFRTLIDAGDKRFDIIDLTNALLDRLDAASK